MGIQIAHRHAPYGYGQGSTLMHDCVGFQLTFTPSSDPWSHWSKPNLSAQWRCGWRSLRPTLVRSLPSGFTRCAHCTDAASIPSRPAQRLVYLAERRGLIKIGSSIDPIRRMAQIHARLLVTMPGDFEREYQLHDRFSALRVGGEWFRDEEPLTSFVATAAVASAIAARVA